MTNNAFAYIILIYPGHNLKDGPLIKAPYLFFILKTDNIKGGLLQLFYTKFSLISDIAITAGNNEINSIFQSGNVVFLKLDLLSTIIETEIRICAFL